MKRLSPSELRAIQLEVSGAAWPSSLVTGAAALRLADDTDALTGLWASGQAIRPKMGVRQRHCDPPVSATTANYVGTSDDVELSATCEDREEIINVPKLASHRRAFLAM
jgi:hypothetical protein